MKTFFAFFAMLVSVAAPLTVIRQESPMKYTVVENAPTENGARTMAVDLKTHGYSCPSPTGYLPLWLRREVRPRPAPPPAGRSSLEHSAS